MTQGGAGEGADIVLGEVAGQAWLVWGEQHIDDLLFNTVPEGVRIEVIVCESQPALHALRRHHVGDDNDDMMWMIHPAILRRVKGMPAQNLVVFAPWSAMLDAAAGEAIAGAAAALAGQSGGAMTMVRYVAADAPAMASDLANLRTGLVEARLASLGVDPARLLRETALPLRPEQTESIDLVIRPA